MTYHNTSDEIFMQIALDYAWRFQTLTLPNPCVGALVLYRNVVIALQAHYKVGYPHAEVLACKEAFFYLAKHDISAQQKIRQTLVLMQANKHYEDSHCISMTLESLLDTLTSLHDSQQIHDFIKTYHSGIFHECEFFVTLEPCNHYGKTPPCAILLKAIAPKRVIIAHEDNNPCASGGTTTLRDIPITRNVLREQSNALLYPFLQWQKKQGFTLFKIAHRLNGDYKHGIISNEDSRIFTHNMRCVADSIVISGETLRNDNPLLDVRFAIAPYCGISCDNTVQKDMPKIYILSKTMTMQDIQTYRICHRDVEIIRNATQIPQCGFTIIEGGYNFLLSIWADMQSHNIEMCIDGIMGYIAPTLSLMPLSSTTTKDSKAIMQYFTLSHTSKLQNFWQLQRDIVLMKDNASNTNAAISQDFTRETIESPNQVKEKAIPYNLTKTQAKLSDLMTSDVTLHNTLSNIVQNRQYTITNHDLQTNILYWLFARDLSMY